MWSTHNSRNVVYGPLKVALQKLYQGGGCKDEGSRMACDASELIHCVSNGLCVLRERAHLSFWCLSCGENGGTETWKVIIVFLGIKRILRPVHLLRVGRSGHAHIEQEQVVMRT